MEKSLNFNSALARRLPSMDKWLFMSLSPRSLQATAFSSATSLKRSMRIFCAAAITHLQQSRLLAIWGSMCGSRKSLQMTLPWSLASKATSFYYVGRNKGRPEAHFPWLTPNSELQRPGAPVHHGKRSKSTSSKRSGIPSIFQDERARQSLLRARRS
eukprot:g25152.t1